ncbi:choice-of-anchor L domain-containing protein [Flavobacterium facile]|uniref:choice-of-anchor L domain-containing protein n=1 Tax=Flavobacterium facile TaxID=2893174 RepID=UPI002E798D65|nr:choice-of-anchor L domain-containing protein [Flavobacterium sp. T-12]
MKRILRLLLLFSAVSFSQTITVDNTPTPTDLVNLLIGGSCIDVNDIQVSSSLSVGSFNRNGSAFPVNQGIIIRSGNILDTQGQYNGSNISSTTTGGGTDTVLQNLSNISSVSAVPLQDLAFLQFDFTPVSSAFSFDFLFASNEYGDEQCDSNDIFAFELTNIATGVTTNLGVIPSTSNPVTVKNIRNQLYNNFCLSANPNLFSVYNVGNSALSTINMRGHTVVLNASSLVTPGTEYRLKLVVADWGDTNFDSAVFISGGSFTNELDLGLDQTICSGDTFVLNTLLDATTYTHQWFQDGNPVGGNTSTSTVNGPGTYAVEVTNGGCTLTDVVVFNTLSVTTPINLSTCNTGAASYVFDLTRNNEIQLGIDDAIYNVFYYTSPANATANISIGSPSSFSIPAGQTIYMKIFNTVTNQFCDAVYQFDLLINATVNATQPTNESLCLNDASFDLTTLNPQVLNGQTGYTVLYYTFQADANAGNGAVITSVSPLATPGTQVVWIRMQDSTNSSCFDITSITITTNPLPLVDEVADVVECSSYVLPVLTNGNYFTGPNGTGTPLFAGNTINLGGTYYIYNGPDANGCFNESSFLVTFIDEYIPVLDNCGEFIVPATPYGIGAFYTAAGGPTGTGTLIPQGTIYTNTTQATIIQTIFYYAEVNNVFCRDERFDINIHGNPLLDLRDDVTFCNSYTLTPLVNGTYNTSSDGTGITLNAGDVISVNGPNFPGTYYVFNAIAHTNSDGLAGACSLVDPFVVNLVDTSLFTTVYSCANVGFTLPPISFGGYYTAPSGAGTQIDPSIPITTSQTVYYYTNTTLLPNCTDNLNYNIVINQAPIVDINLIPTTPQCDKFTLPVLTNGAYYTLSGGPLVAGQTQLIAGQEIGYNLNQLPITTYYMYNETTYINPNGTTNVCFVESPFNVTILQLPNIIVPTNQPKCAPFAGPVLSLGQVYTAPNGPNGTGILVTPSLLFNSDQQFYGYYEDPATGCVVDIPFLWTYDGINLPNYIDVNECDSYRLPILTHTPPEPSTNYTIGYYFDANGVNQVPNGHVFNSSNTPDTIFVYAVNDGRFSDCISEDTITITVSDTPVIPNIVFPTERCGTYVLPTLPTVGYTIGYFSQPNGVGPITNLNIINTGTTSQTFTYYIYATATNNINCKDEQAFTFTIHPLLDLTIQGGIICVDPITNVLLQSYTIQTGLNPTLFNVNWYLNGTLMGTGVNYTALEAGIYDVEFIKLTPDIGTDCNYRDTTVTIIQSSPAAASFTVSSEFDTDNTFITVTISAGSLGNYLFQLEYPDGSTSAFQSSNVFTNLESGEYFVNIYDTLGNCSPTRVGPIYIVNYPNYFTPNGDGIHETWNITDLAQQPNSIISIFDRYGKLLKQISPSGIGWDGKYNGKDLPSTDYWFSVEFTKQNNEKGIFKSHFTLKR